MIILLTLAILITFFSLLSCYGMIKLSFKYPIRVWEEKAYYGYIYVGIIVYFIINILTIRYK